jgi:hypothetical protein
MWIMRKYLSDMNPVEAMDFINDRFKKEQWRVLDIYEWLGTKYVQDRK